MTNREIKKLEKLIFYILGRRPDEFGIILDKEGFVPLKELHKILTEEPGTKALRKKTLVNFFILFGSSKFDFLEEKAKVRVKPEFLCQEILEPQLTLNPPLELFVPVRPRAWVKVSEEGLIAERIVLTPYKILAERMSRRKGALVIKVDTSVAMNLGGLFERYIEKLYISSWIPALALKGPKIDERFKQVYLKESPKEKPEKKIEQISKTSAQASVPYREIFRGKKKKISWKRERRKRFL